MWSFDSRIAEWSVKDVSDVDHPFSDGEFRGLDEGTNALFYSASLGRVVQVRRGRLMQWDGERWTKYCDFPTLGDYYRLDLLYREAVAFDAASQRVYLFGGAVPGTLDRTLRRDVVALELTSCAAEIIPTNAGPVARENATATWDSERNRLVVFGGSDTAGERSDTWEFDPVAHSWTARGGAMPPARDGATSVYDPVRRRVLLHGGSAANGLLYDTWELDSANGSWQELVTTGPSDGEEAALIFDTVRNGAALVSTRGAVWHLSGDTWLADLNPVSPSARSGFSGGYGSVSGVGVFFGGTSGDGQRDFLGDLWIWRDGWRGVYPGVSGNSLFSYGQASPSSASGSGVPSSRTGHVLATGLVDNRSLYQPKDVMVLFGGEGASNQYLGLYGDTWTFDATKMEWTPRPSTLSPRGRTAHAMAVFPNRGYVMFGGLGRDQFDTRFSQKILKDTSFSDTWVWELSTSQWRKIGSEGPSARYGHAMATNETTNELILFGGRDASGVSAETWRLNLATTGSTAVWQKLSPPSSPLARFGHSMTWDPVRQRIVLSGGEGASASQSFEDTWEWDSPGQRWVLRNVAPLEGRAGHVSFFDRKRGMLLAFGGFSHREAGRFALTHGDTLAFYRPTETDPSVGFPNGARCTSAAECGSGACVDGFCCNTACNGQCGACDLRGFEGTCSPVAGTPHGARPSCGSSGAECASQCNGIDMAQCNLPPVGTACGPAPGCFGDNTLITGAGSCDANGACVTPQVSCGNYICCDGVRCRGPTACVTDCQGANSLCAVGYKCNGAGGDPWGKCYKPAEITSFTVTPTTAKVGVPMTFQVMVTDPGTAFEYSYTFGDFFIYPDCSGPTCTWTPVAADVGRTANWKIGVRNAAFSGSVDDSETITLTVQP
jgi:N-acetylneuraminic acid mutarotase